MDRDIAAIKAKMSVSAFEAAYDSGQGMMLDEVATLALSAAGYPRGQA